MSDIQVKITREENANYFHCAVGDTVPVDLEKYVAAVVASEIGNSPLEACKAQAVAARTFALSKGALNGKVITDASSTDQAYRAARCDSGLFPNAVQGAQATAGEILTYNGQPINAVYSASNGGRTVSSQEKWGGVRPYLIAQDDPWDNGPTRTGHGVGMSQRGAKYAAGLGINYQQILAFYYPGSQLTRLPDREADKPVSGKKRLTIYRHYLTQNDCYQSATYQETKGVQVHSTGANNPYLKRYVQPDDGRLGNNPNGNSHNRPGGDVCASAYIGKLQDGTVAVYQALPWDYRCWLSGSGDNGNANRMGYKGFEICEDGLGDETYFREAVMGKAVLLSAYICQMAGVSPYQVLAEFGGKQALAVMDHRELHGVGLASNHADITHWLKKYGLTMHDFRRAVQEILDNGGVEVEYVDCADVSAEKSQMEILKRNSRGSAVKNLQEQLNALGYHCGLADGIFGAATEAAVRSFQAAQGLTVDGIAGESTQNAIAVAANSSSENENATTETNMNSVVPLPYKPFIYSESDAATDEKRAITVTLPYNAAVMLRDVLIDALGVG